MSDHSGNFERNTNDLAPIVIHDKVASDIRKVLGTMNNNLEKKRLVIMYAFDKKLNWKSCKENLNVVKRKKKEKKKISFRISCFSFSLQFSS